MYIYMLKYTKASVWTHVSMYIHISMCLGASQVAPVVKNLPADAGGLRDSGSIPGSGRFPGGGHGNPLQYSCLENPTDSGAWRATVHRVAKSWTRLKWLSTHTYTCACVYQTCTCVVSNAHMHSKCAQSCTLCASMDCRPPGSSIHEIF